MSGKIKSVFVLGLGKVGSQVATLLHETGFEVVGADHHEGLNLPFSTEKLDFSQPGDLKERLKKFDAVVSCLPYHFNLGVASAAHEAGIHYFDLTEDVRTTKAIIQSGGGNGQQRLIAPQGVRETRRDSFAGLSKNRPWPPVWPKRRCT